MKRGILFLLSLFLIASTTLAKRINEETARKIAIEFLTSKRHINTDVKICNPYISTRSVRDEAGYFIFNSTDGKGFAIVAAEDELPEIIGYSATGHIDSQSMSDGLKLFLESYSQYVEDIRKGVAIASDYSATRSSTLPAEVEPIVKTQWNQPAPYNKYCPDDCPAGCVAVAMGQIMNYHKWPNIGTGASFTTYNGKAISVDFSKSEYRWDLMKNTTKELKEDEEAADAVAKLLFDCGIALKMNYSKNGSSAFDKNVPLALFNFFGYKHTTLVYDSPNYYSSKEEWLEKMKQELVDGRPIYYSASSPKGGGQDAAGHAFVISGYDEKDMVHVNWGWGGKDDGYYDIFRLDPGAYAFTDGQTAIYGIVPNTDGIDGDYLPLPAISTIKTDATELASIGTGYESFNISVGKIFNFNPISAKWSYGIGLYDNNGNFIKKIQTGNFSITLEPYYYRQDIAFACSLPSDIQDGEYIVKMFFKYDGNYVEPRVEGGAMNNYFRIVIKNSKATIDSEPVTSGISEVIMDGNSNPHTSYYSISGKRITSPSSGDIVIKKQGRRVSKVIVK
ncbi:MAG: C10 family peptidase [Prevotellaceae bacterium]|nr:C10 family peptidase [Prevotellaceae bacterium]